MQNPTAHPVNSRPPPRPALPPLPPLDDAARLACIPPTASHAATGSPRVAATNNLTPMRNTSLPSPSPTVAARASASSPDLSDWRTFRAALVASEASEEGALPLPAVGCRLARDARWAHALAAPEKGALLVAARADLGPLFTQAVVLIVDHGELGREVVLFFFNAPQATDPLSPLFPPLFTTPQIRSPALQASSSTSPPAAWWATSAWTPPSRTLSPKRLSTVAAPSPRRLSTCCTGSPTWRARTKCCPACTRAGCPPPTRWRGRAARPRRHSASFPVMQAGRRANWRRRRGEGRGTLWRRRPRLLGTWCRGVRAGSTPRAAPPKKGPPGAACWLLRGCRPRPPWRRRRGRRGRAARLGPGFDVGRTVGGPSVGFFLTTLAIFASFLPPFLFAGPFRCCPFC